MTSDLSSSQNFPHQKVEIRCVDARESRSLSQAVVEVYRLAFSAPPYNRGLAEAILFRDTFAQHTRRQGFRMAGAFERGSGLLVGFAYGFACLPGNWWYEKVSAAGGRQFTERWLRGSFQLAEIGVIPEWQGQGVGGRLFDILLEDLPHPRAVLSTLAQETPAQALYRSRGWQVLIEEMYFPAVARTYRIMGKELSE
jgi:ribosomal protein S18 acetylase RimI-like enzyme